MQQIDSQHLTHETIALNRQAEQQHKDKRAGQWLDWVLQTAPTLMLAHEVYLNLLVNQIQVLSGCNIIMNTWYYSTTVPFPFPHTYLENGFLWYLERVCNNTCEQAEGESIYTAQLLYACWLTQHIKYNESAGP